MPYCTLDDLKLGVSESDLIDLTDDEGAGVTESGRINRAIAKAEALIDGYLSGRYALPLPSLPPIIRDVATDLSLYYVRQRRGMDEDTRQRYDDAIGTLAGIASGKIRLTLEANEEAPEEVATLASFTNNRTRIYTPDVLDTL